MSVVEFLIEYRHTSTRTWKVGDRPTLRNKLVAELMVKGVVKYLAEGCGCRNQAQTL